MIKTKSTNLKLWSVSSCIFLFVALYNYMFPLIADDLVRCNIAALSHHAVLSQLRWDYLNWTGRMSAQILIYFFLNTQALNAITLPIAAIITGFCFVAFIRLSYILLFWEEPSDRHLNRFIILTLLILFYLNPIHSYTETIGFKTIVIQYFWGTVLIWYLLYKLQAQQKPTSAGLLKVLLLFALGLLTGNYNEIIAAATIFYILFSLWNVAGVKHFVQTCKNNALLTSFLIGNIIGFLVLITAPGNYARQVVAMQQSDTSNLHYSLWDKIHILLHRYYQIPTKGIFSALAIILFITAIYLIFSRKKQTTYQKQIKYWLMMILGFIITLLLLTPVAYYFPGAIAKRLTFIPDMLLFYLVFSLVMFNVKFICEDKQLNCNRIKLPWQILCAIMVVYFIFFLTGTYFAYQFNQSRIQQIQHTTNAAHTDFVFIARCPNTMNNIFGRGLIGSQVGPDASNVFNIDYAHYYGAGSAREIPCDR